MKKTSLAVQFRQTFVLIVILSIIASITTIALSAFLLVLSMNKTIYPPNFYEKQIPFVEAYIRSENVNILLQSGKSGIDRESGCCHDLYDSADSDPGILPAVCSGKHPASGFQATNLYHKQPLMKPAFPLQKQLPGHFPVWNPQEQNPPVPQKRSRLLAIRLQARKGL